MKNLKTQSEATKSSVINNILFIAIELIALTFSYLLYVNSFVTGNDFRTVMFIIIALISNNILRLTIDYISIKFRF